jgi:hypothetical protein
MKIHRAWIRATAAAVVASIGTQVAVGQYAPYGTAPPYPSQPYPNVAPYGVPQNVAPVYPTSTQSPQIQQQQAAYPTTQAPATTPAAPAAQTGAYRAPAPQYAQPQYVAQYPAVQPSYPVVAGKANGQSMSHNGPTPASPNEQLPTPPASMNGNGGAANYDPSYGGYPVGGAGCNCSYPNTGGYNGGYPGDGYGGVAPDYGIGQYMDGVDDGSQWFGGVYGLYMTRSKPAYRRYTVGVDSVAEGASPATPYFPTAADTENESDCSLLIPDWRTGYEVRFGCTFDFGDDCDSCDYGNACGGNGDACGGCNSCESSCEPCCTQTYAWEVAFWSLDRDVQNQYVDGPLTTNFRYYGMVNYAGLEYDDGTNGVLPVNTYYNYQIGITGTGDFGTDQTVLAQRVRTNFWAQNLELNFLRLPLYCGGGDPCGCDPCAPAFSLTGLCGLRYFRCDDDFEFGTAWGDPSTDTFNGWTYDSPNELYHDIQVENHLVGFQLGANMNYNVASRWSTFWDTNFGLYNNYITHYQSLYNGSGLPVVFSQDGREATVVSKKNDVAFLGEMRLGGAYNFTNHCRGVLAYRAIAISGLALSQEQIKPEYSNWTDTANIDADSSIIIHGVQTGVEFAY